MSKFSIALSILVLHFTFHSIQAQSGETKTGTATISGRVTLKGEPARDVVIILENPDRWDVYAPRARADDNGRFSFTSVAAGGYSISAVAPGYVSHDRPVSVADGEEVKNADLEIKRGGVIAGRIIDSQGHPVIEERISLFKFDSNNKPQGYHLNSPNNMFKTDDRGVYRIFGLPAGRYLVSVGHEPSGQSIAENRTFYPRVFHPDAPSEYQAKAIELSEGSEVNNVDITVSDPKEARDVSGRVVDAETGQPVGGVRIEVRRVSSDGSSRDGGHESESGPNGGFRVSGLLPGKYALLTQSRLNTGFVGGPVIFDVSEGDASGIELKVRRGTASISGIAVIEGTNDPKVLAKLSLVGIHAEVQLADSKFQSSVNITPARVNADGSFRINGIPAGKARISVGGMLGDGLQLARIEHNGAPADRDIEIEAGEQVTSVRIVFLHGVLTLHGEVKVVGGTLPDGFRFGVIAIGTDQSFSIDREASVDARGRFAIEYLVPGEYEIYVLPHHPQHEKLSPVKKRVVVGSDNQQPITIVIDLSRKEEDK
jgi:hypothetical protein